MRRSFLSLAALGSLVLGACAPSQVVVTGELEVPDPTQEGVMRTVTLANVVVELVPFDRDEVFDSLEAAAPSPEPDVPQELRDAQAEILAAQEMYQSLETRWGFLRDTLKTLSDELERYNPAEPQYIALFQEWTDLDAEYSRVERQVEQAFNEYDSLEKASFEQLQAIRIQRENWADEAFEPVDEVFAARMDEAGRQILTDTTSADGIALFERVPDGQWWVHARYELPTVELYWNFPIDVPSGEVIEVRLDRARAEERPKL